MTIERPTTEEIFHKANSKGYETKLPFFTRKENLEANDAYHIDGQRLNGEFKRDLELAMEVENNPKKDKLWHRAWEYGHANGFHEVAIHYVQLAELIQ